MLPIVARRFGDIETQKVLAFQILFDCLEDGRQIVGGSGANSGGASDQGRNADLNLGMNIFLPRNQL